MTSAGRLQALILALVLATVAAGALALQWMERRLLAATGETLALAASDIADKLDLLLYERAGDIASLAKTSAVLLERGERATLASYLAAVQQAYPLYLWIGVTDEKGRIVAATDAVAVGRDRSDRPWFQAIRDGAALLIEDPRRSREAGQAWAIALSAPVTGSDGRLLGVVGTRVSLATLTDLFSRTLRIVVAEQGIEDGIEWEFLARDGAVLDESLPPAQAPVNLLALGAASARLSLDPDRAAGWLEEMHTRRSVPVVTGYAHTEGYGRFRSPLLGVLVRLDREQVLAPIRALTWRTAAAATLALLPLLTLTLWSARQVHRAWRETRDSEERFRATFEQAAVGVAHVRPDGRWLRVNHKLCGLVGYSREELLERTFQDITHPDDLEADLGHVRQLLSGAVASYSMEKRYLRKDGAPVWINLTVSLVRDEDGNPDYFIAVIEDIDARKRAEAELARLHADLEQRVDERTAQLQAANRELAAEVAHRVKVQDRLEAQVRISAFAADVGRAITSSATMAEGLQACAGAMVRHLDAAFARVWTLDPDETMLVLRASAGLYTNLEGRHARIPVGQYKIGVIAQSRAPHLTNRVIGDPLVHDQAWAKREGMVAFAGYPLLIEDRLYGVMAMFARQPLSDDALAALQTVAHGVAMFIEHKRAEEVLRKSHEWFQALVTNASDLITVLRTDGTIVYQSPAARRVLGYDPSALCGKNVFEFVHPDDLAAARASIAQSLLAPETVRSLALRIRAQDGTWRTMESSGRFVETGELGAGIVLNSRDITERRQAEEALAEREMTLRAITDAAQDAVILLDAEGRIAHWNPAAERILGRTAQEALGRHLHEWLAPVRYREAYERGYRHFRETGQGAAIGRTLELAALRPDGTEFPIDLSVAAVKLRGRWHAVGVMRDITERKRAEQALARSRAMLRLILDTIPQHVFWKDRELRYLGGNSLFARAAGVEGPDALPGKTDFDLAWKETAERYRADDRAVMESGKPKLDFEEPQARPDGGLLWLRTSKVPLTDEAGRVFGVLGIYEDITERKAMEQETLRLTRMATLGQLVGGLAHELRNPLFILTGELQLCRDKLLQRDYATLPADLKKIEATVARLTRITERFSALARPYQPKPEPCSVAALLGQALDVLAGDLGRNRIRVDAAMAPDLPPVLADPKQLQEVFLHLIMNAMEAMAAAHGKGTLTVRAKPSAVSDQPSASESNWIEVRIQDDGPGIAPEHRARLFEPFFSTRAPTEGTGLGLWTVRMNLMQLHGTVSYETEVGAGATFIVRLPATEKN